MTARRTATSHLVTAALVTALLAASAWISIPLGAVPVTLQTFFVVLAALLLPARWVAASLGLYLLLGAAGLPIFSAGNGGLGVLFGPTGGYLVGFFVGGTAGAVARATAVKRLPDLAADAIAAVVVVVVTYACGVLQLALVANLTMMQAVTAGAVPFIVPDAIKAAVAVAAAQVIRRSRAA